MKTSSESQQIMESGRGRGLEQWICACALVSPVRVISVPRTGGADSAQRRKLTLSAFSFGGEGTEIETMAGRGNVTMLSFKFSFSSRFRMRDV